MSPTSVTNIPSEDNIQYISNENIEQIVQKLSVDFEKYGLEIHPFKVKWYNDLVGSYYALNEYHDDALALLVISAPSMFEKAFLPYLANVLGESFFEAEKLYFDPIDKCMQHYFDLLQKKIATGTNSVVDKIHDFELIMPQRKPKILLQSAAHVSGAAFYYKQNTNGDSNRQHRLGVCVHPRYGGWFGIRGAFILKQLLAPSFEQTLPPNVVTEDKRAELLVQFNEHWKNWTYRDIIPAKCRYSQLQIDYFTLVPRERLAFIKSTIVPILHQYKDKEVVSNNDDGDSNTTLSQQSMEV